MKHRYLYLISALLVILAVCLPPNTAYAQTTNIQYVVQPYDSLKSIAYKYCTTWDAIYNLNYATIGPNPNLIYPGMVLIVPANCSPGGNTPPPSGVYDRGPRAHATGTYYAPYYTVARGDTLSAIGQRFGIPWQNIAAANHINGTTIYTGQVLFIPGTTTGTPPPPPPPPPPQGSAERVSFSTGATSATRAGTISNGAPKTYVLKALAGQVMYVAGRSHAEALTVSIKNSAGQKLTVSGANSQVNFNVQAYLPYTDNYYVTFKPVTQPESPTLAFDVTFTIPALP
jgi:LysM repeat protein